MSTKDNVKNNLPKSNLTLDSQAWNLEGITNNFTQAFKDLINGSLTNNDTVVNDTMDWNNLPLNSFSKVISWGGNNAPQLSGTGIVFTLGDTQENVVNIAIGSNKIAIRSNNGKWNTISGSDGSVNAKAVTSMINTALNKYNLTGLQNTANQANQTANSAETSAKAANTNAQLAQTNANTAKISAGSALDKANTADTDADTADKNAQNAQATAQSASDSAIQALNKANTNATSLQSVQGSVNAVSGNVNSVSNNVNTLSESVNTLSNSANTNYTSLSGSTNSNNTSLNTSLSDVSSKVQNNTTSISNLSNKVLQDKGELPDANLNNDTAVGIYSISNGEKLFSNPSLPNVAVNYNGKLKVVHMDGNNLLQILAVTEGNGQEDSNIVILYRVEAMSAGSMTWLPWNVVPHEDEVQNLAQTVNTGLKQLQNDITGANAEAKKAGQTASNAVTGTQLNDAINLAETKASNSNTNTYNFASNNVDTLNARLNATVNGQLKSDTSAIFGGGSNSISANANKLAQLNNKVSANTDSTFTNAQDIHNLNGTMSSVSDNAVNGSNMATNNSNSIATLSQSASGSLFALSGSTSTNSNNISLLSGSVSGNTNRLNSDEPIVTANSQDVQTALNKASEARSMANQAQTLATQAQEQLGGNSYASTTTVQSMVNSLAGSESGALSTISDKIGKSKLVIFTYINALLNVNVNFSPMLDSSDLHDIQDNFIYAVLFNYNKDNIYNHTYYGFLVYSPSGVANQYNIIPIINSWVQP